MPDEFGHPRETNLIGTVFFLLPNRVQSECVYGWADCINNCFCFQAIVGVAGGATRTATIQHQARRDNMADVAAKDGSQVSNYTRI